MTNKNSRKVVVPLYTYFHDVLKSYFSTKVGEV